MSVAPTQTRFTPEDLLAMPEGDRYELVNGELVEKPMGMRASLIGGRLFGHLNDYCVRRGAGLAFPADAGYQCFLDAPEMVRKPDVSVILAGRLPGGVPEGFCRVAPDLAAEVVSPNDKFEDVLVKVSEYQSAGVRLVWVVVPATQSVHVYRLNSEGTILRAGDELTGEDVLPGFRLPVAELFRVPPGS